MTQKLKKVDHHVSFVFKVVVAFGVLLALILLAGCSVFNRKPSEAPKVVESHQPVLVQPEAPVIVIQRYQPDSIPEYVAPDDPRASSCLTQEGEDQQRRNMQQEQRIRKTARTWAGGII